MFKNYLKTTWRTITHNKVYSAINIIGLTVGLCTCMLVVTVVIDDLSYDRMWTKADQLYRINSISKMGEGLYDKSSYSFAGLGPALKSNFPEVEASAAMFATEKKLRLNKGDLNSIDVPALSADSSFWQLLDIQVVSGNPRKFIEGDRDNVIISESFRKKFFPSQDPVGKIIYEVPTYSEEGDAYIITGVMKDLPSNSVLRSDIIVSRKPHNEELRKNEGGSFSQHFILLKPGTNIKAFTGKVNKWYSDFVGGKKRFENSFQPIKDVYLHSDFAAGQEIKGNYKNVYILSGVALLLLCIACINFINLGTARALQRLKETGVRKILGAARLQLVWQFLMESFVYFLIAAIIATGLYQLSLPLLKNFIGHNLSQTFTSALYLFAAGYLIILIISLLTGIYPALVLSAFKPAATLKGEMSGTRGGSNIVRKSLVVLQFAISVVVLIALIVVQQQVSFLKHKDIGYNATNLLSIGQVSWNGKGETFKNELLNQPGVVSASITSWLPTYGPGYMSNDIEDPGHPGNKLKVWYINGDLDFTKVIGLQLTSGRFLDKSYGADALSADSMMRMDSATYVNAADLQSSIITDYTAKLLKVKNLQIPIKQAHTTPVGIIKDFNNETLKEVLKPTIIVADKSPQYGGMLIKVAPGQEKKVMAAVGKLWSQFYQNKLLDLKWADDMLATQYEEESKLQQLFSFFSGISMFLAALGVLGLIIQSTALRKKEVGIRKVLGASVASIVRLFSVDFLKLVFVAILVASPVAWWLMNKWLLDFAYRIQISPWIFVLAGIVAALIALITIGFQTIKAAIVNPVKSLRTE